MPIIPKRADLIDDLINASQRISNVERGCGTGPDTADTADPLADDPSADPNDPSSGGDDGTPDPTVAQDMTIEIIPRGVGTLRKSGVLAYPDGGLYPLYGVKKKNYLKGFAVNPNTYVAASVEIQARVKTRVVKKVADGAWSTLFHLPPGWWPTTEVTASALTALGGVAVSGPGHPTVPIRVTTEGHVQAQGPFHHPQTGSGGPGPAVQAMDLRGIKFTAGGGACPGIPTDDPTSAGDGRAWDFCQAGDPDIDPPTDPGTGGGGTLSLTLEDLGLHNPSPATIDLVVGAAAQYGRATDPIAVPPQDIGVGFVGFTIYGRIPTEAEEIPVTDGTTEALMLQGSYATGFSLLVTMSGTNVPNYNSMASGPIIGLVGVTAAVGIISTGVSGLLILQLTFGSSDDPRGKPYNVSGYFNGAWYGPGPGGG